MKSPTFLVQQIDLFRDLSTEKILSLIVPALTTRKFEKHGFVIHKGDNATDLFLLLHGRLQVEDITPEGQEVRLNVLEPVSCFGELSMIDNFPHSASVRATESSVVGTISKDFFFRLMRQEPSVSGALIKRLAAVIRSHNEQRTMLNIHNVQRRLITLLQGMAHPTASKQLEITRLPTQLELASMIHTTRESVSRAMSALQAQNLIRKNGRTIILALPSEPISHEKNRPGKRWLQTR